MAKSAPKHFFSKYASVSLGRSSFDMSAVNTTTIKPDYLYPCFCKEVMPGDTWSLAVDNFTRLISPIDVPMMDNLYMDYHFWFVPLRLVWDYSKNFFGEQRRPTDPTDFTIPQINFDSTQVPSYDSTHQPEDTPFAGLPQVRTIYDYFGIPIQGSDNILTGSFSINALPFRAYNLIYDEWYRDEQRCNYSYDNFGNSSDTADKYYLLKRGKRFDYFTSSLLEPQIGNPVDIPLGISAPVVTGAVNSDLAVSGNSPMILYSSSTGAPLSADHGIGTFSENHTVPGAVVSLGGTVTLPQSTQQLTPVNLYADLTSATPATIATLRQAFQIQAYNEINARCGTRYTEFLYGQYGVISPDARLQRPEFLGSCEGRLTTQPIVQNSSTDSTSPQGTLTGIIYGEAHGDLFTRSFTEHGYIIGIQNIRADLTYYQGLDRMWSRSTPLDFAVPIFANLTDQEIKRKEILLTGVTNTDDDVFGYAERYAEYKYSPNTLTGLVRPNAPLTIGQWSLAQQFPSSLSNNDEFIESTTPIDRIIAVTDQPSFIVNQKFTASVVRELPSYSDPMKWFMRG